MPYTLFAPAIYLQTTVGQAYASSTTLTDVSTNPQFVLPPNSITTVGQGLHFLAGGYLSSTGTPNLTLGIYRNTQTTAGATGVGGAAMGASTAAGAGAGASNWGWRVELTCTFVAVGSSGSFYSVGMANIPNGATVTTVYPMPVTTPQTAVTFDTTKPNVLSVGATWGTNSASNTLVCTQFQIRLLS